MVPSERDDTPALKRLKLRDPRNVAELLVPGLRSRAEDDPVRAELAQFGTLELHAAVQATRSALPRMRRRVARGCLVCTRESGDVQALQSEFAALVVHPQRRKRGARAARRLSRDQQRFLSWFFTDDQEFSTLCLMHLKQTFNVSAKQLETAWRRHSSGELWKEEGDEPDDDNDINVNDDDDADDSDDNGGNVALAELVTRFDRVGEK
jgi:hypothetical protein